MTPGYRVRYYDPRISPNPALEVEARYDRAYDDQTASSVHVWRDDTLTRACTFHRGLCQAITAAAIRSATSRSR